MYKLQSTNKKEKKRKGKVLESDNTTWPNHQLTGFQLLYTLKLGSAYVTLHVKFRLAPYTLCYLYFIYEYYKFF